MNLYTDSIRDESLQMLEPNDASGRKDQDQDQLRPGQRFLEEHGDFVDDADMKEFSELLSRVSTKVLWRELMTHQQQLLAKSLWEACNYGGKPKPGDLKNMEDKRIYAEWVLRMDHRQQLETARKKGKLVQTKGS